MSMSAWWLAIRPRTLPASIAPVLLATAIAYGDGGGHFVSAALSLAIGLLIQIGTNLSNDYFDFKSGVDTRARRGPVRVTQAGLISPFSVKWAFISCFILAGFLAIPLLARAGWPVAAIAALSTLAGIFYTAGPRPLSHLGLGELFVLIFFGPVVVGGTYYVQTLEINNAVLGIGLACGFLSTAIIVVNNLRDIETDRAAGKRTLAVRFGKAFARMEYLVCLLAAAAVPPVVYMLTGQNSKTMLASGVVFMAVPFIHTVFTSENPSELNEVLAATGKLLVLFCVIFALGWVL